MVMYALAAKSVLLAIVVSVPFSFQITGTEIGQTIIALIVVSGYVASHVTARGAAKKVEEIHLSVNSNLERAYAKIARLEAEVARLKKALRDRG